MCVSPPRARSVRPPAEHLLATCAPGALVASLAAILLPSSAGTSLHNSLPEIANNISFEAFDDLDGHVEVTLDDQWVTFMPRDGSPGGGVLSIHSVEYEGIDVSDGNVEQDRDEGCGFASSLENVWWPDVPVCF